MRESSEMRKDPPVVESRASRQTSPRPHRRRLYASDDGRDPASKVASEEWAYWAHKLNGTALLRIAGEATKGGVDRRGNGAQRGL